MRFPGLPNRDREVLDLWERAIGLDRWRRDDALLAEAGTPRGLGARNVALLALRNTLFDRAWALRSGCPACAAECEFEVDSVALAEELRQPAEPPAVFGWAGRSVTARAPTVDDLQAISRQADQLGAVRGLVARCVAGDLDLGAADDGDLEDLGGASNRSIPGRLWHSSCAARPASTTGRRLSMSATRCGANCSAWPNGRSAKSTPWRAPMAGPRRR